MPNSKPLPSYLIQRYHGWKATTYSDNSAWYKRLAKSGQQPRAMMISCCDSRIPVTEIFEADQGEFFTHRNIANLVPPYAPDGDHHGTSAALEYAVMSLRVTHVIVMGHSNCGGVKGFDDSCSGHDKALDETSFVGPWMNILRPGYDRVAHITEPAERTRALEKECVVISLNNLLTFPFIVDSKESGLLSLHGLWIDIEDGTLEVYSADGEFHAV